MTEASYLPDSTLPSTHEVYAQLKNLPANANDYQSAFYNFEKTHNRLLGSLKELSELNTGIYRRAFEAHHRYALAYLCITMFLIGAILGAMIKKGGIGLPIIISLGFFVFFHAMMTLVKKYTYFGLLDSKVATASVAMVSTLVTLGLLAPRLPFVSWRMLFVRRTKSAFLGTDKGT